MDGDHDQRQSGRRNPRSARLCIDSCQCARVPHPGNRSPPSGRLKNTLHPRRQIPYAYPHARRPGDQTNPKSPLAWTGRPCRPLVLHARRRVEADRLQGLSGSGVHREPGQGKSLGAGGHRGIRTDAPGGYGQRCKTPKDCWLLPGCGETLPGGE